MLGVMSRIFVPLAVVAVFAIVAAALSNWTDLQYLPALLIVAGAILVNGMVATLEDDLPGGFNNPDGSHTPRYVHIVSWVGSTFILLFVGGCVLMLVLWSFG